MMSAELVARYFLSKDPQRKLFNRKLETIRGKDCYEGNVRLNKYLHIAQLLYFTKFEKKLFQDELYAYHNGAVVKTVLSDFSRLCQENKNNIYIDQESKNFLDKVYICLENAEIEDLIEISHEDPAWEEQEDKIYSNAKLNLKKHLRTYKKQYADILKAMDL